MRKYILVAVLVLLVFIPSGVRLDASCQVTLITDFGKYYDAQPYLFQGRVVEIKSMYLPPKDPEPGMGMFLPQMGRNKITFDLVAIWKKYPYTRQNQITLWEQSDAGRDLGLKIGDEYFIVPKMDLVEPDWDGPNHKLGLNPAQPVMSVGVWTGCGWGTFLENDSKRAWPVKYRTELMKYVHYERKADGTWISKGGK